MNWELFWLFVILNIVNVILQTAKSIATIKCGKIGASCVNAVAFGLYTIVVIYTVCDLNLWVKVGVVAISNLIGVYVVKLFEEKARKDKLWKIEASVLNEEAVNLHENLNRRGIPHNYIENLGRYTMFNIYCETQKESAFAKEILSASKAKYFVSEAKTSAL